MGTLKVGDVVIYKGGAFSTNKGEVGTIVRVTPCMVSEDMFASMELLVPKQQPMGTEGESTLTGITAPLRYFTLFKQGWEV